MDDLTHLEDDADALRPLSEREALFVAEYLKDLNAAAACRRAGYTGTPNTTARAGWRLLAQPHVGRAVAVAAAARLKRLSIDGDEILREAHIIATTDILALFNDDGTLKPVQDMPAAIRRAVSSIKVNELFEGTGANRWQVGVTKEVKLWSKEKAIELLLRNLGLLKDNVHVTADDKFMEVLRAARKRAG